MTTVYVLLFLMWSPSQHAGAGLLSAEFTSKERCETAAEEAARKFNGWASSAYWVCMPK